MSTSSDHREFVEGVEVVRERRGRRARRRVGALIESASSDLMSFAQMGANLRG